MLDEDEGTAPVYVIKLCCGHLAKVRPSTPDHFVIHQCDKVEAHVELHEPPAPWNQLMKGELSAYGTQPLKGFYLVYSQRV